MNDVKLLPDLRPRGLRDRLDFGLQRTACVCTDCSVYCTAMPGYLIPGDPERIGLVTGRDPSDVLLASPGALVKNTATGETFPIPTLVPARRRGACIFRTDDGRCRVHAVSPFGCAYADSHQSIEEGNTVSALGLRAIQQDHAEGGTYSRLWRRLWDAGRRAPGPATLRRAMGRLR